MRNTLHAALALAAAATLSPAAYAQNTMEQQYSSWPSYDGDDLELKVDDAGTHFTLWSPSAEAPKCSYTAATATPQQKTP